MFKGLFPESPTRIFGVAIIVLVVIALVNNFGFFNSLVKTRGTGA